MMRQARRLEIGRVWRLCAVAAAVGAIVVSQRPAASSEAGTPETERMEVTAALGALEARVARLEARLGFGAGGESIGGFRARYQALVERERAVAARADSVLAFVPSLNPVRGASVSSGYGARVHPVLHRVRQHHGIDLAAPLGALVQATAAGRVVSIFRTREYGLGVDIDHGESGFVTRYTHLSAMLVREGARVRQGEALGRVGASGLTTGPTLHYEVYFEGRARDPAIFLPESTAVGRRATGE